MHPRTRPLLALVATIALAAVASPTLAAAARTPERTPLWLAAHPAGELIEVPGASERAELLTFDAGLAAALLVVAPGEEVVLADWPTAPGERADVVLTRREVYAPDAVIWEIGPQGPRQVPRSRLAFFWGGVEGDLGTRAMVSVDPDSYELRGLSLHGGVAHELLPTPPGLRDAEGQHLIAPPDFLIDAKGRAEAQRWTCGDGGELPQPFELPAPGPSRATAEARSAVAKAITSLHTATVAFDTDNEIMLTKFANNTTTATNYIASLLAAMNVVYERDLLVRLVQGTTFLRVSTTPDPYAAIANTFEGLSQVTNYWAANHGGVSRAVTAMLSGRTSGTSGIAWVGVLCSNSNGYSFTKVASTGTSPSSGDIMVVAHEIGHNFGSPHTHCYNRIGLSFPDHCRSGEVYGGGNCYSGAVSCPAPQTYNGFTFTGSLMSYCHLAGCNSNAGMMVFHPITVDQLLDARVQAAVNQCIFPFVNPTPTVNSASPASGSTAGGTVITISGANFQSGATVTVGGTAATGVTFVNGTTLRATVPAHAAGAVTVRVTNPGGQLGERANTFFYAAPQPVSDFYTVAPCRMLDTRNANGSWGGPALAANGTRTFTFTGRCGIPSGARAVSANVTLVSPAMAGTLGHYPGNAFPLGTTVIGFTPWTNRAGSTTITLATNGTGTVGFHNASAGTAHLVVDVNGYWQ